MFKIELRKPYGNPKWIADVRSIEAMLVGYYDENSIPRDENSIPRAPDPQEVMNALPWCYRRAYATASNFWFCDNGNATCHLYGARHRYLGAIWATPYKL